MVPAYIGLGSNLADPAKQIRAALHALANLPQTRLVRQSRLYASAAWGIVDQPDFVNAVAEIETALVPRALLAALLDIERDAGRVRESTRWGPRVLDLDILVYAQQCIDEPGLRIPHPYLHERAFALMPLMEIAPHLVIPGRGKIDDLMARIDGANCHVLGSNATHAG
ncbi:MAG TPA: 2-amino-4-hydroxy-6-hydroxymethyldihydropteridine diphosphokinase [Rudaea sp.]|nr:2-amino-4-hydroxy-6-hydroxymethyldihydropteridine diphosphokinase [Rudaea sp.]